MELKNVVDVVLSQKPSHSRKPLENTAYSSNPTPLSTHYDAHSEFFIITLDTSTLLLLWEVSTK